MKKMVSIIIRTYNEERHIDTLLNKVYSQNFPENEFEVVIVDSGSEDNTLEIIKKYPVKLVQIKPKDFTFGYSLNKGIEAANGKYMLMVSAHCYPIDEKWISKMVDPLEKDTNIAVVYGKQRGYDTTKYSEHQIFKTWFPDNKEGKQDNPFCNNANCAIRRDFWEAYKYNEELTGLEDLDWANEMLKKSYDIYYQCEAGVYHIHEENYKQVYNRYKREAIALKNIFPSTKFNFSDFIMMLTSNLLTDWYTAFKEKKIKEIWRVLLFRFCQFLGAYDGNRFNSKITYELKKKFYYPRKFETRNSKEEYIAPVKFIIRLNKLKY